MLSVTCDSVISVDVGHLIHYGIKKPSSFNLKKDVEEHYWKDPMVFQIYIIKPSSQGQHQRQIQWPK